MRPHYRYLKIKQWKELVKRAICSSELELSSRIILFKMQASGAKQELIASCTQRLLCLSVICANANATHTKAQRKRTQARRRMFMTMPRDAHSYSDTARTSLIAACWVRHVSFGVINLGAIDIGGGRSGNPTLHPHLIVNWNQSQNMCPAFCRGLSEIKAALGLQTRVFAGVVIARCSPIDSVWTGNGNPLICVATGKPVWRLAKEGHSRGAVTFNYWSRSGENKIN